VHRKAQGGGSGVDVAASVYGGVLEYTLRAPATPTRPPPSLGSPPPPSAPRVAVTTGAAADSADDGPRIERRALPRGFSLTVFFCGESARTSELLARVYALAGRDPRAHRACFASLREAALVGADATAQGDAAALVAAAELTRQSLAALGKAADAPIVPQVFSLLHDAAAHEGAVFLPSGAGGGDIGLYAGLAAPSPSFLDRARVAGMVPLPLAVDTRGVHVVPSPS
jgi:phosphomevalonate kinase